MSISELFKAINVHAIAFGCMPKEVTKKTLQKLYLGMERGIEREGMFECSVKHIIDWRPEAGDSNMLQSKIPISVCSIAIPYV